LFFKGLQMPVEIIFGWVGSFLLAICAVPQAIASYKQKHADGVTHGLLWCWMLGEIFTLFYLISNGINTGKYDWPLIMNYTANIGFVSVVMRYKYFPQRS